MSDPSAEPARRLATDPDRGRDRDDDVPLPDSPPPPTMPPAALEAVARPRPADSPRRCFICLTDEEATDPPGSWVNPCPCTLEAHQDCIMSWVTDCERSNKPLQCPVCKARIALEGPWNPVVAVSDMVMRRFTRASPFLLFSSVSLGVQFSLQMYGALALWSFSGKDVLLQFMLGSYVGGDGRIKVAPLGRERLGNVLMLTSVAPALLFGHFSPWLSNKVFLPAASLYGFYHALHDQHFLAWPPSPQLAMAIFPYVRSVYYNIWREFVFPYEINLNRRILGLPPLEPQQSDQPDNNQRLAQRNGEGGIMGFLQGILDALDPDEDGQGGDDAAQQIRLAHGGAQGGDDEGDEGMVVELVIGEFPDDEQEIEDELQEMMEQERAHPAAQPGDEPPQPHGQDAEREPAVNPGNQPAEVRNHEVPQAPPARRQGLGSFLSSLSNSIVSALILPGISYALGELLRLALPKSWTIASPRKPWFRSGSLGRPGLLQQQWGRSLVGGCLFVVMKDAVRLYTKYHKVASMDKRRVKNVDRRRGGNNNQ